MSLFTIFSFYQNIINYYNVPIVYWFTICLMIFSNSWLLLIVFITGYMINKKINIWLKNYLKQPLPDNNDNEYGMPSGHCQEIWFTFLFIYYTFSNTFIKIFYGLLALYISYNCLKYHTVMQMIIGILLGIIISSSIIKITNKFISLSPIKT